MTGVSTGEFCTNPEVARSSILSAFTSLGEIDGIQQPSFKCLRPEQTVAFPGQGAGSQFA
ncbi:MAG: hypothetical protein M5U22_08360 [Thermoleophilia bacterium]|nr:hypothetical protein [Thermoleophilia bacterium]